MWNLFCRLSVNKLCGSLQAAYLTFSVHLPHTGSTTLTRAASWGYSQAEGQGASSPRQQKSPWSYSQQPPQTLSVTGRWRAPLFLDTMHGPSHAPAPLPCCMDRRQTKNTVLFVVPLYGVSKQRAAHRICVFSFKGSKTTLLCVREGSVCMHWGAHNINIHMVIVHASKSDSCFWGFFLGTRLIFLSYFAVWMKASTKRGGQTHRLTHNNGGLLVVCYHSVLLDTKKDTQSSCMSTI